MKTEDKTFAECLGCTPESAVHADWCKAQSTSKAEQRVVKAAMEWHESWDSDPEGIIECRLHDACKALDPQEPDHEG